MGSIYANAERVLAWLGRDDTSRKAEKAFALVKTLVSEQAKERFKHGDVKESKDSSDRLCNYGSELEWGAFVTMTARSWFKRV